MTSPESLAIEDQLTALQEAAVLAVTAKLASDIQQAITELYAAFLQGATPEALVQLVATLVADLRRRRGSASTALRGQLERALQAGHAVAGEVLGDAVPERPDRVRDGQTLQVVAGLDEAIQRKLGEALEFARAARLRNKGAVVATMGKLRAPLTTAERDVAWAVQRAASEGTARVAARAGVRLLWVAERNACLHCLAYSGRVVAVGSEFPRNLTFGDKPLEPYGTLLYPPLHPNCRCHVEPYDGPDPSRDRRALDYASGLAREARRTVVRGWSEHSSEPARLRAADRLLRAGASLPPTVIERARRDVRRGRFNTRLGRRSP